jgi:hypothetical protein
MIWPAGLRLEPATEKSVRTILNHPRKDFEQHERDLLQISAEQLEEYAVYLLGCTTAYVAREGDLPIVYFSLNVTAPSTGFVMDQPVVNYLCVATPMAERYAIFFTKLAREFVRCGVERFPDLPHVASNIEGSAAIHWLEIVGFKKSECVLWDEVPMQGMYWPNG